MGERRWPDCVERWRALSYGDRQAVIGGLLDNCIPAEHEAARCLDWLAQPEPAEVCAPAEVVEAVEAWQEWTGGDPPGEALRHVFAQLHTLDDCDECADASEVLRLMLTAQLRPAAEVRAEARRAALEEAANVCEGQADDSWRADGLECARRIRALVSEDK